MRVYNITAKEFDGWCDGEYTVEVDAELAGILAKIGINQRFGNDYSHNAELLYMANDIATVQASKPFPKVTRIICNGPATIVFWDDKTKTVVKCSKHDWYDEKLAVTMCYMKKLLGDDLYASVKRAVNKDCKNGLEYLDDYYFG